MKSDHEVEVTSLRIRSFSWKIFKYYGVDIKKHLTSESQNEKALLFPSQSLLLMWAIRSHLSSILRKRIKLEFLGCCSFKQTKRKLSILRDCQKVVKAQILRKKKYIALLSECFRCQKVVKSSNIKKKLKYCASLLAFLLLVRAPLVLGCPSKISNFKAQFLKTKTFFHAIPRVPHERAHWVEQFWFFFCLKLMMQRNRGILAHFRMFHMKDHINPHRKFFWGWKKKWRFLRKRSHNKPCKGKKFYWGNVIVRN